MRIVIDGSVLKAQQGGVRTYVLELARALAARPDLQVTLATPFPDEASQLESLDVVPIAADTTGPLRRALWRMRSLKGVIQSRDAQVLIVPVHEMPLVDMGVPTIMVVYDVGAIAAPAAYGRSAWLRYTATLKHACSRADAIVCISQASLMELYLTTGTDPSRCSVIGLGPQLLGEDGTSPVSNGGLPYVLYVGTMYRYKNVESLVRAFADPSVTAQLVLAGPITTKEQARLQGLIQELPPGRARHEGFVTPERLQGLYRGAAAVALPSLHEGFGLTALEAMRAEVPLIATALPAVREVAGDAAIYVERPLDPTAWAESIQRVCLDGELRGTLVPHARERAALHTWERVSEEFAALTSRLVA